MIHSQYVNAALGSVVRVYKYIIYRVVHTMVAAALAGA